MNIDVKIKFSTKEHSFLCFSCAAKAALLGHEVETNIDDYDSEYYMGQTWCEHPFEAFKIIVAKEGK